MLSQPVNLEAPPAADYEFTEQIGHLLRRAYQRHLAIFQAQSADPDLTSTQFVTLCALRDLGPVPQTDLVKATWIDQATIRGIIHRLGKRNLIALAADPNDRRKTTIAITQAGLNLVSAMIPRAKNISESTMGELNPAERAALIFTLRKMIG